MRSDAAPIRTGTGPIPVRSEDDPGFNCKVDGNRVCGTPLLRALVKRLAQRPGLVLPGRWSTPPGPVLVDECFASYPGDGRTGRPPADLLACLAQPDPRQGDPRVITWHQAHVLHQLHANRSR
jgi:hypothetical protein